MDTSANTILPVGPFGLGAHLPTEILAPILELALAEPEHFLVGVHGSEMTMSRMESSEEAHMVRYGLFPDAIFEPYPFFSGPTGVNARFYNETIRLFYRNNTFHFSEPAAFTRLQRSLPADLFAELSSVVVHHKLNDAFTWHYLHLPTWDNFLNYNSFTWTDIIAPLAKLPNLKSCVLEFGNNMPPRVLDQILSEIKPIKVKNPDKGWFQIHYTVYDDSKRRVDQALFDRLTTSNIISLGGETDWALHARTRRQKGKTPNYEYYFHKLNSICVPDPSKPGHADHTVLELGELDGRLGWNALQDQADKDNFEDWTTSDEEDVDDQDGEDGDDDDGDWETDSGSDMDDEDDEDADDDAQAMRFERVEIKDEDVVLVDEVF